MKIASGVTDQFIYFVAVDSVDFVTRKTGLSSFTVYRSRNGGTATLYTTPEVAELSAANMPGVYRLLVDEDMTIDAGDETQELVLHITAATMAPVTRTIELFRPKITAGNTLGVAADGDISGNIDGAVATVTTLTGHTPQTGDTYALANGATGFNAIDTVVDTVAADVVALQADLDNGTDGLGALKALIDTVDSVVDGIQTDLDNGTDGLGALKTLIDALNDVSAAQVNAEVLDALATDTYAEIGQAAVASTNNLAYMIRFLFKMARNKKAQTASTFTLYADDESTVDQTATLSTDGTTAIRGEISSGP
jgi:hypothetical protein